ncbi:MAG: hypothetical protein IJ796_00975 [Lachnospiraceae bacterium]|nr:hypothetical protein [Lachnospiraceae bacterium]
MTLKSVINEIYSFYGANHIIAFLLLSLILGITVLLIKNTGNRREISVLKKELCPVGPLLLYGITISLLLCIPFTALVLRHFQTVFFSYSQLWAMVPVIPIIAAVFTCASTLLKKLSKGKAIALTGLMLAIPILFFGIGSGKKTGDELTGQKEYEISYEEAIPVLERLSEAASGRKNGLTILSTPAITEYSRQYSGNIKTIFGRDIWDGSLAAYNYTVYDSDHINLFHWLLYCDVYGCVYYLDSPLVITSLNYTALDYEALDNDPGYLGGPALARLAKQKGVDAICFSLNEKTDTAGLEYIRQAMSADYEIIDVDTDYDTGYYIMYLN